MKPFMQPEDTYEAESMRLYQENAKRMPPREFRDGLTKAIGGVRGVMTNVIQWNRWAR